MKAFALVVGLGLGQAVARPVEEAVSVLEELERHRDVLYPVLGGGILLLIAVGVLAAMRTDELSPEVRTEAKREIVRQLRRELAGRTVEQLAGPTKLSPTHVARLLEAMRTDGQVEASTDGRGVTVWRMKGL